MPVMQDIRPLGGYLRLVTGAACCIVLSACGWIAEGLTLLDEDDPRVKALAEFEPRLKIEEVWSGSVGGSAEKSSARLLPLIQGGVVFVSSNEGRIAAFAADDGKRLWRHSLDARITFGVGGGGRTLMLGTAAGEVIAFSPGAGKQLWRKRLSGEGITAISRSRRGIALVRDSGGGIIAIKASDGGRLWHFDTGLPTLTLRGMSVPYLHGESGFIGLDDGRLLMVSLRDGNIEREFRVGRVSQGTDLDRLVDIDGQFRVHDGVLYITAYRGRMLAIDIKRRSVLWLAQAESYAGLDVDDDYVYMVDTSGELRAFDRISGTQVWSDAVFAVRNLSAPLAFGEAVVVGDDQGYLYWLSRTKGEILARKRVSRKPITRAPMAWRNRVIALGLGGDVSATRIATRSR